MWRVCKREVADGRNPRDVKFELGIEIVDRFHGSGRGVRARDEFIARFQQGAQPDSIPEVTLHAADGHLGLAQALKGAGLVPSTSDAIRQIRQGAVRVDGERVEDIAHEARGGRVSCRAGRQAPLCADQHRKLRWTPECAAARAARCVVLDIVRNKSPRRVLTGRHAPLYCAPLREGPGRRAATRRHCKRFFDAAVLTVTRNAS